MENVLSQQLAHALTKLQFPKSTLALNLAISPSSISGWLNGKKHPTVMNLIHLSKALNVSLDWLLLNSGPMHLQGPIHISYEESALITQLRALPENSQEHFLSFLATLTQADSEVAFLQRARAAKTLHSAQIAMILFDDKNLILDINNSYLKILNIKAEKQSKDENPNTEDNRKKSVIGTSILDWVRSDQRATLLLEIKKSAENCLPISFECDHIRVNDSTLAHTYVNGTFKKSTEGGFFLATAFNIHS